MRFSKTVLRSYLKKILVNIHLRCRILLLILVPRSSKIYAILGSQNNSLAPTTVVSLYNRIRDIYSRSRVSQEGSMDDTYIRQF